MKLKISTYFLIAFLAFIMVALFSISAGAVNIPLHHIFNVFMGKGDETYKTIILELRLPRVIEAVLVGMGLSVTGIFFQGLLRNPMADPYILGISSGAALGATIATVLALGIFGLNTTAFVASLITIAFVYSISRVNGRISIITMLLAGIAISTFMSAIISLMMLFNHNELGRIIFWTMGSFNLVSWEDVMFSAPVIAIGSFALYTFARDVNAILTGEEVAEHLGVNTELVKKAVLAIGSLITATAVSVSGVIGFVGLIIPHISRLIVGPDNRVLVPFGAITGATFLLFADLLARVILRPAEVPVGIITAAFGGPFFLYLLIKNRRKGKGM